VLSFTSAPVTLFVRNRFPESVPLAIRVSPFFKTLVAATAVPLMAATRAR
jgi:hypothetical protein